MAELPLDSTSSVQGGYRPVIIVQNNVGNAHAPTVQVIPLTSQVKKQMPTHTIIAGFGLSKESTVLAEQLRTVGKGVLKQYIGQVDDATMARVNRCMMIQLGLLN